MLIDAVHPEETRVAVVEDNRLEEFDFESATKAQLKGNIFLAKVVRVEPSLQAVFMDYGAERHGFLSLHEIHPDYYQLPVEDREEFEQWVANAQPGTALLAEESEEDSEHDAVEEPDEEKQKANIARLRSQFLRRYKIQEVIKRRQILLVQVAKEERGNKGAALTTYLSLAGRYIVLMPNSERGGGVSRKITNAQDRKRLKTILESLDIPSGMGVVARTAGVERSKADIKKDYDYLLKVWNQVRAMTLQSTAPSLIHEEASLIKRAIRDIYTRDITEILVEGEEGYKTARQFIKSLMPSHARRVQLFKDTDRPLFQTYGLEEQIANIYETRVNLNSGGYLMINATEALVAIDVNSGRATRERNIEETALRTNLEAATEIARQLRIRDLAGLVVIDFIDMAEQRNAAAVERRMKEALKSDRARIQTGRIGPFGLMELSRQRLGRSVFESSTFPCPCCGGVGVVRATESTAIHVLRAIEVEMSGKKYAKISASVSPSVANYLLNYKRGVLWTLEEKGSVRIIIEANSSLPPAKFDIVVESLDQQGDTEEEASEAKQVASHAIIENTRAKISEESVPSLPSALPTASVSSNQATESGSERGSRGRRKRRKKFSLPSESSGVIEVSQIAEEPASASDKSDKEEKKSTPPVNQPAKRRQYRSRRRVTEKNAAQNFIIPSEVVTVDFTKGASSQQKNASIAPSPKEDSADLTAKENPPRVGWWQRFMK
jgi:ribonuclease E